MVFQIKAHTVFDTSAKFVVVNTTVCISYWHPNAGYTGVE